VAGDAGRTARNRMGKLFAFSACRRVLVGYLETENFEGACAEMAKREVNERWQRDMADFFCHSEGELPYRAMEALEEVFHL
jgi:L-rhamnose mutarotase